jgi:TP901 family phage tail tape measure protein
VSEVHRASASLQQLQRELLSSNKAIASSTKLANNLFRDTLTGSGQFSSHFVNLNSDVDKFGKNLDAGRLKLRNYFSTFREHATTQKGMIRELAKEQVMLQNAVLQPLGRNAQGLMQYNVMIPRGLDAVKNGTQLARMEMQIMNRALSEGAGSLINWGKNTQWAGRQLTVGLTVPLTMFGAAAGKAFREADAELVRLTKVYGGLAATSAEDLKSIRQEVVQTAKSLSQTMGASFKDTIALGADIAATGQMGNELLGSIAETTRLSILGEVDRQDAMKATLSIQTAFKQNTEELTESINFLNAVENQTSTTLGDLVEAIPKAGPVIQQLGGDVKDLALYLTAMREGGINASEGANALKSGLASLINPTKQTVGMMSDFGIDVMGMVAKNTGNTTGLLTDLQKALDSLDPLSKARAMEQMFGKFQFARMSALLNNLGKEGSQTLQVMELMKASTSDLAGIAERELGMITESASGKYKRAMESLKASLADIGEDFLPIATKLLNAASKILDFFSNLPGPIKKVVTYLAGFTAIVGPLIMLTGVLANFFGYITKGIVQLRAFFMKANGWKMLTPEIIAAQKAAEMVENAFYSDAAAAQVLHNALQKLVLDYQSLQAASMKGAVPLNPGVSTVGGSTIVAAGRRIVDPTDPYVGDPNTRAMSHINPRDPNNPATIFGGVPGAVPVNRGISRTPQMYMHDRLPNYEGVTSIKGISTGIVPGEAAKFHALMATLGMQTEQEIASLKKTIAMGGTVSRELLDTFDDVLPITQRFADSAATQAAAIVQQMRNAEITVEQAKARILALNAQIEADMGAAVSAYAASRGRTIDLTRAPMMDQPVVDANGQFTLRDLYKKKANASVMEEFGRLRGVRTFGAPYSIQTTRMPRFNDGGGIESFGPGKTMVSGPSSINYDDRLGSVPVGGYVLNQQAAMDPANAALVAMAPSTYLNNGGNITAALTPREVVFGPQIQRMPELYAAVDAANSGYNFGGQIMNGVTGYGRQTSKTPQVENKAYYKKRLKEYLRFINNPRYEDDIRLRMIMLDAAEMVGKAKMPMSKAIGIATSNFDLAKSRSGGSLERFIDLRVKQVQGLERKFPELKLANSSDTRSTGGSKALNYELNNVRSAMLADRRFKNVWDLIEGVSPTDIKNSKGMPYLEGLHARGHIKRHGTVGYATSGHMGVAAVIPDGINRIMARLQDIGISPDVLNLTGDDARKNFEVALKSVGMHRMTTVDDIATALEDNNLFKSKAEIQSGRVVRASAKQKNDLQMFLEAVMSRKRWVMIPRGRPPIMTPVLARLNKGGMIPGGAVSRDRSSYGNVLPLLRLLTPTQQLKVLQHARSMSFTGRSVYPETSYSHILSPTTGRSFPVPGVGGVYDDQQKNRVFFKAVPNEPSLIAETRGTEIGRILRLTTPVQTRKTIRNPLDPTGKSKFLGAESPYDEGFINPNTAVAGKFTQDEVLDQLIASMIFGNKDLSRSNVHGRRLADVGNGGVLAKASMNDDFAKIMPSMEEMAMINLLQVRGGARKDFAHDTAPIIAKMTPKQYGAAIKKKMEAAYPELKRYVLAIPRKERKPYLALLKRFEEGMDVNWAKYHSMHANPKYHAGGPIGPIPLGGPIKKGRSAYGRKGNPAARAEQERLRAERAASYRGSGGSSYTATGNPQMQVARVPYVGGTGVAGNAYAGVPTASMARTVSTMRLAQFPYMNMPTMPMNIPGVGNTAAISAAFASMGNSIKRDSIQLAKAIDVNARVIAMSTKASAQSLIANTKSMSTRVMASSKALASSMQSFGNRAVTGTINLKNAVIQEQNAYAARHYPPGMAPTQGFFGPGMIGGYRDVGEGVQSRKVGSFGFRKTEYLVNNAATGGQAVTMNKAQAQASGVSIPGRSNGMSMGAQMGIGMAGSMGGMALMQKEKVNVLGTEMSGMSAGMGLMIGSSILPMLPFAKAAAAAKSGVAGVTAAVRTLAAGAATAAKIIASIARFAKAFGPIGVAISTVVSGLMLYKKFQDAKQDASMGLSMTAKAAEQAGIKYFDLNEEMKTAIENRKLLSASAKGGENLSVGLPGIAMDVKQMKEAKEEGKKLKDFIESLNRSEGFDETLRLVNNQKAQFIAAGMSVEEANKKVYGALANSEKNGDTFKILSDKTFAGIVDKADAATFAVGNLINTLNKGAGTVNFAKEVGEGFEGLINIFDLTTKSLLGTKDEAGNIIDEFAAYKQIMSDFQGIYGDKLSQPIGEEAYNDLARSNKLLGEITTKADTVEGILAKWTLFSAGFAANLQNVDSDLAIRLAGFTSALQGAVTDLGEAGGAATTFGTVETALEKLQKAINKTSAASQRAANAAQRNAQEELKLISKKIKLIDDEKNKKLESLRATQEASNYALELQKLQIEYADAISRGDMTTANRAQLDIDQLTLNRQSELAQKAVEDAAAKLKAPLEKKATGIQEKSDARATAAAIATDNASAAKEVVGVIEGYQKRYNQLAIDQVNLQLLPPEEQRAAQKEVDRKLLALIKEIQKSGTGNSLTAKSVRDGFSKYFTESGKAIEVQTTSLSYVGSTLTEVKTLNKKLLESFQLDAKAVEAQALAITGGVKIDKLRNDLVAALSRYMPNTPYGTAKNEVFNAGSVKDYSSQKNLGKAGSEAAKPPTLGGSGEKYVRTNNDGMEETFTVFTYKDKSYVVDMNGNIYKYDYNAQTVIDLDKPVGQARAMGGQVKHFGPGGDVSGPGTKTSDSIPAMLSNGEYVIKADSVAKYGTETFDALNAGKFADGGLAAADPQPAVDYTPLPSTPISKLGKSTQAQIKYLTDWTNLLNTYYAAKYKDIFSFKPGEKIATALNTMPVVKGTKVVKNPDQALLDTQQYGAYYSHDRSDITMGLGLAGRPAFIPNPIQDQITMKNLNQTSSFPFLSKGMSPVDYIESISKDAQKNPYARMEILTTLFHEFAHALQFRINGYIKNSQESRGLTEVGDPNKPTPGFLNIESGADVMAGGIFKEMYSNGYIPQIKKSIIDTLLKSQTLTASYGDVPAFNKADPASEGFTWHPQNANFRFKSVMTGMGMGDSAAFDDTLTLRRQRLTENGGIPLTFAEIGDSAAAIAAITPNMIPKGFHKGGPVGHKHDVNPFVKGFRWFKNAMNNGQNPASAAVMDVINQVGYLGQTALSPLTKGIVPKPTKVQDKSFQEFTGIPQIYRALTGKTSEGPMGQLDPRAGKITDWAGALTFLTPWRGGGRLATQAAEHAAVQAPVKLSTRELLQQSLANLDMSSLPRGSVTTSPTKPVANPTSDLLSRMWLYGKDPKALTNFQVGRLSAEGVPGFEGLRPWGTNMDQTAEAIASQVGFRNYFEYYAPLVKSDLSLVDLLSKPLFHGGNLPRPGGVFDLRNAEQPSNWYQGQLFAADSWKQALGYTLREPDNSLYSITSALKPKDVIDLRHDAKTLSNQHPYIFAQLLKDIQDGKIQLKDGVDRDQLSNMLIAQEGGRLPRAAGEFQLRDTLFQAYFTNISKWLAEHGIRGIVHRNGTRVVIPEIGTVAPEAGRATNWNVAGTDALAYTTVKDSIESIAQHHVTGAELKAIIARIQAQGSAGPSLEGTIFGMLGKKTIIPHKANGGLISTGSMSIPKFDAGVNMVPADMLALIHKNEAVIPANMNPFNPNATSSAIASGSVYNIQVELNGTTVTAQDVAAAIHKEMKIKEMTAGVNRRVNG